MYNNLRSVSTSTLQHFNTTTHFQVKYIIFSLLIITLIACAEEEATIDEGFTRADTKYEVADSVEILYSDSAIVRVRITAPLLFNYSMDKNPRREFPNGILVEFFDEGKKIQSRLTAKRAVQYDKTNKFVVEDSVVIRSIKNELMETEGLTWDESTQRIFTNRFITITTETEKIQGYGFESDYDFQNWELKKVTGRIQSDKLLNEEM